MKNTVIRTVRFHAMSGLLVRVSTIMVLTNIRRIPGCFGGFSVLLRHAARKFNRWLAVPAAKSVGFPPQRAGAHRAACIRAYLDPRPLHLLPLPFHAGA